MTRVALLQLETSGLLTAAMVAERLQSLPADVEFAVLPELWPVGAFNVGSFTSSAFELPAAVTHGELSALATVARDRGIWLHAGSVVTRDGDSLYNTSLLIDDSGEVAASYRKIHLFGFGAGEADVLSAGTEVVVVDTPLGRLGLSTCYDLRFPELYREQRQQGAEIFVIPSGWPQRRTKAWQALATARAMENQAWVLGCNAVGTSGPLQLGGRSVVVDPDGELVSVGADGSPDIVHATVDVVRARDLRASFPVHNDRKL